MVLGGITHVDLDHATIHTAWEHYVVGSAPIPDVLEGVRPEIAASWRRSKGQADPFAAEPPALPSQTLEIILSANELLCRLVFPYLTEACRSLRGTGHSVMLSDRHGFRLLLLSAEQEHLEPPRQTCWTDGRDISEAAVGTNGIGTALATAAPVTVWGPEHFLQAWHPLVSCAVPIRNEDHGVIGCLGVTGPVAAFQPNIMDLLTMAVRGIENELRLTRTNAMLRTVLDSCEEGVLLLDPDRTIRYHDAKAPSLLRRRTEDLIGQPLSSALPLSALPEELQSLDRPVDRIECALSDDGREPIEVSLSIRPIDDPDVTLVLLRAQKDVHKMAGQIAGFRASYTFSSLVGTSGVLRMVKSLGQIAAETPTPVLIFGETGTGKEMLAQAIHNASDRAHGPFVCVHCGAVPKGLLERELFGDAVRGLGGKEGCCPGKLVLADGGTLFLDEIDELPLDVQSALLEVLRKRTLAHPDGSFPRPVDVKLLAATSVSLLSAVQEQTFRDDLYYRLNALSITIPPLRERTEDVPPLVRLFAEDHRKRLGGTPLTFDGEAMQALLSYDWPGNIRELEDTIERTAQLAEGPVVHLTDLPSGLVSHYYAARRKQASPEAARTPTTQGRSDDAMEHEAPLPLEVQAYNQILHTLKRERGNVKATAAALGIPLSTLYRKLNKYDLDPKLLRQSAKDR